MTALVKPDRQANAKPWNAPLVVPECPDGWVTGTPDYVGIGAQRCGTSWWYDSMRRYPGIQRSPLGKEVHYFDKYWQGDPPEDIAAEYASLFPHKPDSIVGEWTPRYLADPMAIRQLRDAAPEAKLLVMFRDPVARYRSAIARLQRLADERGDRVLLAQMNDAIWRGYYFEQLRHVFDLFSREQVLVLQFERCAADPVAEMERTLRFLGLEVPDEPPERLMLHKQAGRKTAELAPVVADELAERYREDSSASPSSAPRSTSRYGRAWRARAAPVATPRSTPRSRDRRCPRLAGGGAGPKRAQVVPQPRVLDQVVAARPGDDLPVVVIAKLALLPQLIQPSPGAAGALRELGDCARTRGPLDDLVLELGVGAHREVQDLNRAVVERPPRSGPSTLWLPWTTVISRWARWATLGGSGLPSGFSDSRSRSRHPLPERASVLGARSEVGAMGDRRSPTSSPSPSNVDASVPERGHQNSSASLLITQSAPSAAASRAIRVTQRPCE